MRYVIIYLGGSMNISFRKLNNDKKEFIKLYKWCQNDFVYEWFEQRKLTLDEIIKKYQNKLEKKKQNLFIITCDNKDIGLVQIYKFEKDINLEELNKYKNIYEFDIFIGEKKYLSKGIGKEITDKINGIIYNIYNADAIILRPFKRNIRAIKCYEKCNFNLIKEYDGVDTLGNKEIISILLKENTNAGFHQN